MTIHFLLRSMLAKSLLLATTVAQAQACIPVEVHNLRVGEGRLMLAGYDSAEAYAGKQPATAVQLRPDAEVLSLQVCGLRGTVVALQAYQDLNANGKLDTNVLGIPAEPFGGSGKPPAFSAPTWDTLQVSVDGKPIVVKLSK